MIIVVDKPKREANLRKHGLDVWEASAFDWATARIAPARDGRFQAVGRLHEKFVSIIFKRVGSEALAIISLRPASRKERGLYEQ
jgi:uncharacterized DUF497 family protein